MTPAIRRQASLELHEIHLLDADHKQLRDISQSLSLGLDLKEMKAVREFFRNKGRNPTDVELQTIGQTWSEHCFHKTFKGRIIYGNDEIESLFKTYIFSATNEAKPKWCISVFEDNAGIIEFNEKYAIAAKVETHNHPSAIEPFGGAATGVGGAIRDILGVWANPIACTDVLGFGPLSHEHGKLPQGMKHPKYLLRGVVAGIGCYSNNMGIPTVNGSVFFDESYVGNIVVYCGCIGLLPKSKFARNAKPNDFIVLAGGKTGRDGIHGVTFASAELTEKSEEVSRPAVQIANPIEEEKLKRAILKVRDRKLGSGITDLGGGGLSSAVGEMARRFGCGAYLELEKVPLKQEGLAPWEIYISESQERMLLLVPRANLKEVIEIFESEDAEATAIGWLTDGSVLRISYEHHEVANLSIDFLFNPPETVRIAEWKAAALQEPNFHEPRDLATYTSKLLASSNIASRERIVRTYDHEVKGNTVIKPLHGKHGGPNDGAVIKPVEDCWKGIVISCGMKPRYGKVDPYWMAASSIDEAIRNNSAMGGRRIALLDNFVWGTPEKKDRVGGLVRACEACCEFSKAFETPYISGKDSLYNESPLGPVTPTLLITAIGIIPDIRRAVSVGLKSSGNPIYSVGKTYVELGGSEYYHLKGFLGKSIPKVRAPVAKDIMEAIVTAIDAGCVRACHDMSEGGLAVAAAEMAISSDHGVELWLHEVPRSSDANRNDYILFSETNSRFLVEIDRNSADEFESITRNVPRAVVGAVTDNDRLCVKGLNNKMVMDITVDEIRKAWKSGLDIEI
jgi:phosphoribosylformylglycinamidine synthase